MEIVHMKALYGIMDEGEGNWMKVVAHEDRSIKGCRRKIGSNKSTLVVDLKPTRSIVGLSCD